jgi:hypothetical protein
MTYTPEKPRTAESSDQLRARIPGWGVDLDPEDRPSYPREQLQPGLTGAHWEFPERQPEPYRRERSIEHGMMTPVFGTAQPLHGVSGRIRRLAYDRYSEGRLAHWLLLMAGDRVDTVGAAARSLLTLRPDNPVTETGVLSEFRRHGLRSRLGRNRVDVRHQLLDPVIVAGPWVAAGAGAYAVARRLTRRTG